MEVEAEKELNRTKANQENEEKEQKSEPHPQSDQKKKNQKKNNKRVKETEEEKEIRRNNLLMIKLDSFVKLKPFIQRYSKRVKLDDKFDFIRDVWVRQHSNKLLLFGITKNHPVYAQKLKIENLDFKAVYQNGNDKKDINKLVSGKKKRKLKYFHSFF